MSQVIVTTGMGRSGTSLVSSLVQAAGVHIGDRLLPPYLDNPHGYFEDVDFYEFHEDVLHERDQTYLYVSPDFRFEPTAENLARAQQLIAARSHRHVWGWKDPRTPLFLTFWHQLLPHARFLFVYRHPLEVLISLLRRGEFDNHPHLAAGLQTWQMYNSNIEAFYGQHPEQCVLVHIEGVVSQIERFAHLLEHKLQLDIRLDSDKFNRIYHTEELQKTPIWAEATDVLTKLFPGLLELYHRLDALADLPAVTRIADSAPPAPLSQLAGFIADFHEPIASSVRHSLLQLLLSLLAPEPTERMLSRFHQNTKGAQHMVEQLWLQVQRLERNDAAQAEAWQRQHAQLVERQLQQLGDQERRIHERDRQLVRQQQHVQEQAKRIKSLLAELDSIRESRSWRLIHSYSRFKDKWRRKAG